MTFKPGAEWNGNRAGRPKSPRVLSDALLAKLNEPCDREPWKSRGATWKDYVVDTLLDLVQTGNPQALKTVFERIEGKVALPVDIAGDVTLRPGRLREASDAELEQELRGSMLRSLALMADTDRPAFDDFMEELRRRTQVAPLELPGPESP